MTDQDLIQEAAAAAMRVVAAGGVGLEEQIQAVIDVVTPEIERRLIEQIEQKTISFTLKIER